MNLIEFLDNPRYPITVLPLEDEPADGPYGYALYDGRGEMIEVCHGRYGYLAYFETMDEALVMSTVLSEPGLGNKLAEKLSMRNSK